MIIQEVLEKVLINQRLVIIGDKSSAYDAAVSMLKNKCGALLVCDSKNENDLVGIITERDIIELLTALSNDDIDFVVDFFEDLIPENDDDNTYSLEQILANAGVVINRN